MKHKWDLEEEGAYLAFGKPSIVGRDESGQLAPIEYGSAQLTVYGGGGEPYESSVDITRDVALKLVAALNEFVRSSE